MRPNKSECSSPSPRSERSTRLTRRALAASLVIGVAGASQAGVVPPALVQKASEEGSVRVIVQLKARTRPEAMLGAMAGPTAVSDQRQAIAMAQFRVAAAAGISAQEVIHAFRSIPFMAVSATPRVLDALTRSREVGVVVEDTLATPLEEDGGLNVDGAGVIGAPVPWAAGVDGSRFAVAILDTGVDSAHPNLAGRVVYEACFSGRGSCPNGATTQTGLGAARACTYAASCDHGTHVASIAAGNGGGQKGVAPGAKILAIQVFSEFRCGSSGCPLSYSSDQVAALERVYELRNDFAIAAVNMSIGGGRYSSFSECERYNLARAEAILNLREAGIATIAAAGNDGYVDALSAPGCLKSAIAVGATYVDDTVPRFSNSSTMLGLMAPGVGIHAAVPGGGFSLKSGTSMATPHVTGAFALMRHKSPTATVGQVGSRLASTGVIAHDELKAPTLVRKRLQVDRALGSWSIARQVVLRTPNGGELLQPGQRVAIRWFSSPSVKKVTLLFTPQAGPQGVPYKLLRGGITGSEYSWTVPSLPEGATGARVLVRAFDAEGRSLQSDISDAPFAIATP